MKNEEVIMHTEIYNGKILKLYVDDVALPNGKTSKREIVEHHGGVCIAPMKEDGQIILVRQYRHPFGTALLELPAGKLEKGENPLEAGIRELREETGASADVMIPLGQVYPTVAYCTEVIHLYLASGLTFSKQQLDEDEYIDIIQMPLNEAVKLVMDGQIKDSKTQIALLKLEHMLENKEC